MPNIWMPVLLLSVSTSLLTCREPTKPAEAATPADWKPTFGQQLALMGHRNWIVIADAAYPLQNAPGIQTLDTGSDQTAVLTEVLTRLRVSRHVTPIIYQDREFDYLPATLPGLADYRQQRQSLLAGKSVQTMPHDSVFGRLDAASKTFGVLILKTTSTIPYSTIFLQLDCAYWNADLETKLRGAMKVAR
jgi:L-fucose mutarotase/ribose pyranase (RbsD/FucU family)